MSNTDEYTDANGNLYGPLGMIRPTMPTTMTDVPSIDSEFKNKILHYLISTEQDGAGIAMGRKSTDGSLYKSRIYEFTEMLLTDIEVLVSEAYKKGFIDGGIAQLNKGKD